MLVMHVICGSFSGTTWTDTRGCTVERSRTSVIDATRSVCNSFHFRQLIFNMLYIFMRVQILQIPLASAFSWTSNFVWLSAELFTDWQAAKTPAPVYSWHEQRGKPVLPGSICPYSFLESPPSLQQPSDCLTLSFLTPACSFTTSFPGVVFWK